MAKRASISAQHWNRQAIPKPHVTPKAIPPDHSWWVAVPRGDWALACEAQRDRLARIKSRDRWRDG